MKLKHTPVSAFFAALYCLFCPFTSFAQLHFEHDINTLAANTKINQCVTIGDVMYFASNDGFFGEELWQFDLATEQAKRLTDLKKLGGNANPKQFTLYDNKVFFRAETDDRHAQLFYYNPANGVVKQATPFDFEAFDIVSLVVFQEKLWFTAQWQGRVNLWSYSAATGVFEEIMAPAFGNPTYFYPNNMAAHDGHLYGMCRDTAYRDRFFRYNPITGVFTHEPTQFDDNTSSFNVKRLVSCEGKLLMFIDESPFGQKRWYVYDAPADSCILLQENNVSIDREVACFAGKFWFAEFPKAYVYDPATNQTVLMNTVTGNTPSFISDIREIDGELYCSGHQGNILTANYKLNTTTQSWEYQPYFNAISPEIKTELKTLATYQNKFFAVGYPYNYDFEIYKYTPDANGAERLTNINQANQDAAQFANFIQFDGRMLFNAYDSSTYRIWQKDLATGQYGVFPVQPTDGGWSLKFTASAVVGNRLYFSGAKKNNNYHQLLSYTAGEDSLRLHGSASNLANIYPWLPDILTMTAHDSVLYLISANEEGSTDSMRIFQFDTRTDAFSMLPGAAHIHDARELTILDNKLYFWNETITNGAYKQHLWVHDLAGNLSEIPLGDLEYPYNLMVYQGKLVFNCQKVLAPFYYQHQIGIYDPNTGLVTTAYPTGNIEINITSAAVFQDKLWISSEFQRDTLYALDPVTGQCNAALDLHPFGVQAGFAITTYDGKLYFNGYTSHESNELWEYDPNTGNLRLFADINPGGGAAYPQRFAEIDDRLYFVADDGWRGREIWSISTCFTLALNTVPDTIGLQSGQIEATVQGGTPPFSYMWSNGSTASGIGGLASGFYEVTVQDAAGCEAVQFTVLCGVDNVVSVADISGKTSLKIYPNPAQNTIFIEKTGDLPLPFPNVQLCALTGQVVREIPLKDTLTQVDLDNLPSGIWLLRMGNGVVRKFVKL